MTTKRFMLVIRGNTKPIKEELKRKGWRWNAQAKNWMRWVDEAHAERIRNGDDEFLRGLGGRKKGCCTTLQGIEVFRSKTFGESQPDQDGFGWNSDQFGNPVASKKIPGSCPDDRI